mgnify:FL=1
MDSKVKFSSVKCRKKPKIQRFFLFINIRVTVRLQKLETVV